MDPRLIDEGCRWHVGESGRKQRQNPVDGDAACDRRAATGSPMSKFKQPELTGPSGEPIEVPDDLSARVRESVLSETETNSSMFLGLSEGLQRSLLGEAMRTAGLANEMGAVITKDGAVLHRQRGGPDSVAIHENILRGMVFFRNHPKQLPLSIEDLEALLSTEVEQVWAVGGKWLYGAAAGPGASRSRARSHLRYRASALRDPVYAVIANLIKRGMLDPGAGETAHLHAVLSELAREGIIDYTKICYGFGR